MALVAFVASLALSASVASAAQDLMRSQAPVASAVTEFDGFVSAFARTYKRGSPEYAQRRTLFDQRTKDIALHNANPDRSWTAGVNHLTDRSEAEFAQLLGWRGAAPLGARGGGISASLLEMRVELATSVDWVANLTSLKQSINQGGCGSCWAVTSSALLESRYEIANKKYRSFSAQQLVDCVPNEKACGGTGGCDGATVELAMQYVLEQGLSTNDERPYHGVDRRCAENPELFGGKKKDSDSQDSALIQRDPSDIEDAIRVGGGAEIGLLSFQTLPSNKARPLMEALMEGPVAISVGANAWSSYASGVFDQCSKDSVINHAVLAVGYGRDASLSKNYYTIRNSWGGSWGENGHIRLFRGENTEEDESYCGTDHNPKEGIACKPYPESVEVCGMCGMLYDSVSTQHRRADSEGDESAPEGVATGSVAGRKALVRREDRRKGSVDEDGDEDRNDEAAERSRHATEDAAPYEDEQHQRESVRYDDDDDDDDDDGERAHNEDSD